MLKLAANLGTVKARVIAGLVVLAIFLGYSWGLVLYGKALGKAEYEKANVKVLKKELDVQKQDSKANAKTSEDIGRKAATMEARLALAMEELNRAIEQAKRQRESGGNTGCDLTPEQLRALSSIYNSYGQE